MYQTLQISQNQHSLASLPSPKHLRFELFKNVTDTQEDSAEALIKLFSILPDGTPKFCRLHCAENMILHENFNNDQDDHDDVKSTNQPIYKCTASIGCTETATHCFDGSVCLDGEIVRYLVPTDLIHHDLSPSKYSPIEFVEKAVVTVKSGESCWSWRRNFMCGPYSGST